MPKSLELVLSVFEGHGWRPREGHKAIVTAKIENHVVTTDPTVLTTDPKFFTELSWELKPNLIRQYKIARVPIRVECLSVSKHGEQENLGYIIVPLTSAVLNVKNEGKKFKLLGGKRELHKNPPSLSLSLCLRDPEKIDITSSTDVGTNHCARSRVRPSGRSLGANVGNELRRSKRRLSDEAPFIKIEDEEVISDQEDPIPDPHHRLRNGPKEDHSFLPCSKSTSTRLIPFRSPGRSSTSSHSPRKETRPSPRCNPNAHFEEGINENGTEMEVEELHVNREDGISPHHRNSHSLLENLQWIDSLGSRRRSRANQNINRSMEGMPNCLDGRNINLKPELCQEGGYFQIGPSNIPGEERFVLSITIVFAKNLDQLIPNEHLVTSDPVYFSYSLLGYIIKTDSIDIRNPNFSAERAAGNIHATGANLATYFRENSELPIHLLVGDLCLASTSINLFAFEDAEELDYNNSLTVEGGYPLVPLVADPSRIEPGKDPILGIMAELSKVNEASVSHPSSLTKVKTETVAMNSLSEESSGDESDAGQQRQLCNARNRAGNSFNSSMIEQKELASEIHKQRLQLLYSAAIEVETWKEDQQELFWKQWCSRESELQQHLAAEWRVRVNSIESNLQNQLVKCDTLQGRLAAALTNLSAREVIVKNRERKLKQLEDELEEQRQILKERDKGSITEGRNHTNDDVWEDLVIEKRTRRALEKQVEEWKARAVLAETKLKEDEKLTEEAPRLRREKEKLSEQLAAAVSRKQFYKLQWVRSVSQLHQLHVAQAHDTLAFKSEMTRTASPEPFLPSTAVVESIQDDSGEDHVLFLEPSRDARGNKVSPKKFQVQRTSGNGIVSERTSRGQGRGRHMEEEFEARRRSSSSSRSVSRDEESFSRTRKKKVSAGNQSDECIPVEVPGPRKRPLRSSINRSRQEEIGTDESDDERVGKSPRMLKISRSHQLERLMRERESLMETSDVDMYESRIQSLEKKIREVVEL